MAWALLAWITVTAARLATGDGWNDALAETAYRMATGIGFMALAWFGLLNIYHGLIKDFSISQIVLTTAALGFGGFGVHVAFSVMPPPPFAVAVGVFIAGELAVSAWLLRTARRETRHATGRPIMEPTIRGSGAVLDAGPDGIRVVPRHETGKDTAAGRFEQRLIRHVERALEIEAISMAGSNSSYWRFRLPHSSQVVELSVIGPQYNTASKIRDGERWLLRIREPKPCVFTEWIGKHFGDDVQGTTRNLGAQKQTQFASSLLADDNRFFAADVPWPSRDGGEADDHRDGPYVLRVLLVDRKEDDAPDAMPPSKPTIH